MAREDSLRNVRTGRSKRDTISSKRFGGKKVDKSKKRRPIINGSPLGEFEFFLLYELSRSTISDFIHCFQILYNLHH